LGQTSISAVSFASAIVQYPASTVCPKDRSAP